MPILSQLLDMLNAKRRPSRTEIELADERLRRVLTKLEDADFAERFAKDPVDALKTGGIAVDVWREMSILADDKLRYRLFLDQVAARVDVKVLGDVLAASTCDQPSPVARRNV